MDADARNRPHWQFALGCAMLWLREQVRAFDFHSSLSGHAAYVGTTPEQLISYIDGFLAERQFVPGGTATELGELRTELLESIAPAYEAGKTVAHSIWAATVNDDEREKLQTTPPENVMTDGWQHVPGELSTSQANWFVEGFCYNWAQEWFAFQLSRF